MFMSDRIQTSRYRSFDKMVCNNPAALWQWWANKGKVQRVHLKFQIPVLNHPGTHLNQALALCSPHHWCARISAGYVFYVYTFYKRYKTHNNTWGNIFDASLNLSNEYKCNVITILIYTAQNVPLTNSFWPLIRR